MPIIAIEDVSQLLTAGGTLAGIDLGDKTIGVIVMPERIAQFVRPEVDRHVVKAAFPLIVEIPDIQGPMEGRKSVKDMIRAAVGVQV